MIRGNLDAVKLMCALFEKFADRNSKLLSQETLDKLSSNVGVYFNLHTTCENLGYEKDGNTHHPEWVKREGFFAHVIILRNRMVFLAISDERMLSKVPLSEFENTSNHDSCWRYGLDKINKLTFNLYEHCYQEQDPPIPEEHLPSFYEANICQEFDNVFGSGLMDFVSVKYETDENKRHEWFKLTEIVSLKPKISLSNVK